jgi:hypothetical protein
MNHSRRATVRSGDQCEEARPIQRPRPRCEVCVAGDMAHSRVSRLFLIGALVLLAALAAAAGHEIARVSADVAQLKAVVPSQSHTMADVGYHFTNLWFAGEAKNWDLAAFYLDEARSHIRWTIRLRPVRQDPAGNPVNLQGIFDGIDNGIFSMLKEAIDKKDSAQFANAYKLSLEACYACHRSAGKPYLRPRIPTLPPQPIITFDPNATWPQ